MVKFLDGPAADKTLLLKRTPRFLRVMKSPGGKWDALDQLGDEPKPRETIYVYELAERDDRPVHLYFGRSRGGWFHTATYRFFAEQPADATLRQTGRWRSWCVAMAKREPAKSAVADSEPNRA